MTLNITLDKAIELTVAVIEREGADKVYEKHGGYCLYVHTDSEWNDETNRREVTNRTPGCIVGHALLEAGLEYEDLIEVNQVGAPSALNDLQHADKLTYTHDAGEYFEMVQISQDNGQTWGDSHEHALNREVWNGGTYTTKPTGWVAYEVYGA